MHNNQRKLKEEIDRYNELQAIQDHLDDLQSNRESMEIVFMSLKNAFPVYPVIDFDEVDKELCRAYDDLMAQVRHLDRSLKRLDQSIKMTRINIHGDSIHPS